MKNDNGTVNIHGKEYQTVALRVKKFCEERPGYALTTEIIYRDKDEVVMKATISDPDGRVLATGHAEEQRNASKINKTSALENCETSAIGRVLAALGLGGTEFATANEVQNAISQQEHQPAITPQQSADIQALLDETGADKSRFLKYFHVNQLSDLPAKRYDTAVKMLEKKREAA